MHHISARVPATLLDWEGYKAIQKTSGSSALNLVPDDVVEQCGMQMCYWQTRSVYSKLLKFEQSIFCPISP